MGLLYMVFGNSEGFGKKTADYFEIDAVYTWDEFDKVLRELIGADAEGHYDVTTAITIWKESTKEHHRAMIFEPKLAKQLSLDDLKTPRDFYELVLKKYDMAYPLVEFSEHVILFKKTSALLHKWRGDRISMINFWHYIFDGTKLAARTDEGEKKASWSINKRAASAHSTLKI